MRDTLYHGKEGVCAGTLIASNVAVVADYIALELSSAIALTMYCDDMVPMETYSSTVM